MCPTPCQYINHESGDEGDTYLLALQDAAHDANIDLRLVTTVVPDIVDGFITPDVVAAVRHILDDRNARKEMGDHNFQVASRYFSYSILRRRLQTLVINVMGMD